MKYIQTLTRGFMSGMLALLLLAGCSDLLKPAPETPAEAGTGRLTIMLTGTETSGGERTLFPTAPASFSKYELAFTPKSGQNGIPTVTVTNGTSHSLTLPAGSWTITALAYVHIQGVEGITDGDYAAARGEKAVTISSASTVSETIDLRGGIDGEGQGVFSYDITIPGDLDSASLEILGLEGGSPVKSIDLKAAASGSFALDSGYWLLKISREKGGDTTVRAEVVHIYKSWTTEASGPGYDFTGFSSAAEVLGFLSAQGANTTGSPYALVLSGLDLEKDLGKDGDPLGLLYEALDGKYVNLDLSACGGNIPYTPATMVYSRPNRDKIVSLILPDGLTSIGDYAFFDCNSLASIDLPDGLTSIGEYAFRSCKFATIDLPNTLTSIGSYAFYGCTWLASIDLPDSLTYIGVQAFSGCTSLTSIVLPDSLTSIGEWAFYGCTSLASIDLSDTLLTSIENLVFSGCTSLASIALPDSLTYIQGNAFYDCTSLASIDLSDTLLTYIGDHAFNGCTSLASIDLPDSLTHIYSFAFSRCTSLTSIDLPDSLTYIGAFVFFNCTSLASIDLPDTLFYIEWGTFEGCESLATIDLPDSLIYIGWNAFSGCTSLATVISRKATPPGLHYDGEGYPPFRNTSSSLLIYVPDASVDAYQSAWSDYTDKIKPLSELP